MLNQPMNSPSNGTVNENKNTHDITLTIKIDSGNMSESKVMEILNKTETLQALNKKLKEMSNQKMNLTGISESQKKEIQDLLHSKTKSLLGIDDISFIVE